ncbi:uncharacterized protein [Dysidea avara]|uniref:uncharacterized protein n=1 Tax=Dysidea avara TaxID=196820 RepID=UPI00332F7B0E
MYYFTLQLFITAFLVTTTIVWSLPVHRRETLLLRTTRTTFKVSQEAIDQLTKISDDSNGLLPLWKKARSLTNEAWLTEEYQRLERKVCRGRIFNSGAVADACKGRGHSTLSRAYLTEYYNEFVIQLKLAEYNYKASIATEIKENYMTAALDSEAVVIKLLNESILPALEFMLQLGSTDTDCSTTEALANRIILQYANCTAVQTSNVFLGQTARSLIEKLKAAHEKHIDNTIEYEVQVSDSTKQWCLTL